MVLACLGTWSFLVLMAFALCRAAAHGDAIKRPVTFRAPRAAATATATGGRFVRRTPDAATASARTQLEAVR